MVRVVRQPQGQLAVGQRLARSAARRPGRGLAVRSNLPPHAAAAGPAAGEAAASPGPGKPTSPCCSKVLPWTSTLTQQLGDGDGGAHAPGRPWHVRMAPRRSGLAAACSCSVVQWAWAGASPRCGGPQGLKRLLLRRGAISRPERAQGRGTGLAGEPLGGGRQCSRGRAASGVAMPADSWWTACGNRACRACKTATSRIIWATGTASWPAGAVTWAVRPAPVHRPRVPGRLRPWADARHGGPRWASSGGLGPGGGGWGRRPAAGRRPVTGWRGVRMELMLAGCRSWCQGAP